MRASLKLEGLDGWNIFKGIKWRGDVKERDESHCLSDTVISGNFGTAATVVLWDFELDEALTII